MEIAKKITMVLISAMVIIGTGCTKPNDPSNGGNEGNNGGGDNSGINYYNGHAYVDLGLPSGTLWATCNVGAEVPEGYGDYFAWGETTGKSSYHWLTYKYCNGAPTLLTKYCHDSWYGFNGFTDNLTMLLPEDDAATANWGSGWRMPTDAEWRELNSITVIKTWQNGVWGSLFIGPNGRSLFLPAAGYRDNSDLDNAGSDGYYWSNLLTNDPGSAHFISLGEIVASVYHNKNRYYGLSVRAVCSVRQN